MYSTLGSYSLRNSPIIRLDHGPIILDFEYQTPFRNMPFRFQHMWTTHPSCKDMVQQAQVFNSYGSRADQLRKKILSVKREATDWNKQVFGKVERDIKVMQTQLQQIQNSINSIEDVVKERALRNELEGLLNREKLMWAQKARIRWIL